MLENILNLDGITILNKQQQSQIKGSGTCAAYTPGVGLFEISKNDFEGTVPYVTGDSDGITYQGINKQQALDIIAGIPGAKWCCESCSTASWL